jgi:hypothetical protein
VKIDSSGMVHGDCGATHYSNVTLRGEVVDGVGLHLLDDADQAAGIGEVAVVPDELAVRLLRILVDVVDAVGVEER